MPTITGSAGPDIIFGTSGNDTITGLGGADELNGGGGNDQYVDTLANMSGDRIGAFGIGDHLIFTDANISTFSYSISGNTLTYGVGATTIGSLALSITDSGYLSATAIAGGGVDLHIEGRIGLDGDFNGDGRADALWRSEGGSVTDWLGQASGGFVGNDANLFVSVPASWTVVGRGDFNGDGRDDIVWRNDNGAVTDWLATSNGALVGNDANLFTPVPTSWQVVGTGDFNGDGRSDLLWRNDNGTVTDWLANARGGFAGNDANLFTLIPASWHVVATGDVNGDGRADVVWRNDDGRVTDWLGTTSGGFVSNDGAAMQSVSGDWNIVGAGDINGDGRADLIWRNDNGAVTQWLANSAGGFASAQLPVTNVPVSWQLVSAGDYNGDHRTDLLWRNDSGTLTDWLGQANGTFVSNDANAAINVPVNWHVQSTLELV